LKTFDIKTIQSLVEGYNTYISGQVKSHSQYRDILKDYLRNQVLNKVQQDDYEEIFNPERIKEFHAFRKSSVVRAAILKFLEYLKENRLINSTYYLNYPDIPTPEKRPSNFLGLKEIEFIFSKRVTFKDEEEKYVAPLVYSLAFFCGFEQRHLISLKLSDVIVEDKLIRNVRKTDHSLLMGWIKIEDIAYENLIRYLEYRESLNLKFQELIIVNNRPVSNNSLNQIFHILKRKDNKEYLEQSDINAQILIKSMILSRLISTDGQAINNILRMMEWNTHVADAYREYLRQYARLNNRQEIEEAVKLSEIISGFTNIETIQNQDETTEEEVITNSEFASSVENHIKNDININKIIPYSEDNDLTMEDIINYDEQKIDTKKENKVTLYRLVRDSQLAKKLKALYNHKCQLCGQQLRSSSGGFTSEVHHIKPYNRIHRGDDTIQNLLVVCPNCHTQFDELYFAIHPETLKVHCLFEDDPYHGIDLIFMEGHELGKQYLTYSWNLFIEKKKQLTKA
jgi:predicted HNH restriction endonuclease